VSITHENNLDKRVPILPSAAKLKALGLGYLAADLVEGAGPLNTLFAQVLYLGQPLLSPWLSARHLTTLADTLENNPAALAAHLRPTPEEQP
jgi:hypothetical protein